MNPRLPISQDSRGGKLPRADEQRLLAAASKVFRTSFPNPERAGCPPTTALRSVARKQTGADESQITLEHLTCCSPCFAEYERLLERERLSRNLKLLSLCAALLITIGTAIWFGAFRVGPPIRQPEPVIVQEVPQPAPVAPKQFEVAVVDLRNRSPVRGAPAPSAADRVVATLPPQPLDLSVYLPIGSEEGPYEVAIVRDQDDIQLTLRGSARLKDRRVTLQLRTDLTGLAPGPYRLGIRKGKFRWMYYPIALTR